MREIKFRIRFKAKKEGDYPQEPLMMIVPLLGENSLTTVPFDANIFEIVSIDEFTGLHDKNGKEVFEGDIVKNYAIERYHRQLDPLHFVVIFKDGSFQFESRCRKSGVPDYARKVSHRYNPAEMIKPDNWEIIGNIYENPELIEVTP